MLLEHFHGWTEGRAATEDELLLVHRGEHVAHVRSTVDATWLDYDQDGRPDADEQSPDQDEDADNF